MSGETADDEACSTLALGTRQWLARETAAAHQTLHRHALFHRMFTEGFSTTDYCAVLTVFSAAFEAIEERRRGLASHRDLTLGRELAALARDQREIGRCPASQTMALATSLARGLSTPVHVLGALYTAHGSAFGAGVMARRVACVLPLAPAGYLTLPLNQGRWRALCAVLDRVERRDHLVEGARQAFLIVKRLADLALGVVAPHGARGGRHVDVHP